uniref:Uncharacterized protein n=1 Tax=Anguilla anguilla TaxID=7936 RepID=A0A0E9RZC2_ANGAN
MRRRLFRLWVFVCFFACLFFSL